MMILNMYCDNIEHMHPPKLLEKCVSTRENYLQGFVNNKGADQPAHPCSLISTFVICLMESIISTLDTSEFSLFYVLQVNFHFSKCYKCVFTFVSVTSEFSLF